MLHCHKAIDCTMSGVVRDGTDDGDGLSLRQIADRCCKRVHIGAAVLPKPLFVPDWDDDDDDDDDDGNRGGRDGDGGKRELIAGATVEPAHNLGGRGKTRYGEVLASEFNSVVLEHHLKWAPLCHSLPGPGDGTPSDRVGRYDFHHADAVVDWALERGMEVKGHVLVWHVTTPPFVEDMSPDEVREQLRRHIFTTVGHFRGRVKMWDVVNESLAPDGTLAENVFLRKLGPGYIEESFRWAHEADPSAFLIYNDNKVEGVDGPKSDGFFKLLRDLKNRGVPVHGAGIQAHFNAGGTGSGRPPTPRSVRDQIRRLGELNLRVNISEMDVRVSKLPPNVQQIAQRQIYRDVIAAALCEPAFDGVWLWGFTDRHTWVSHFYYDDRPLIFDEEYGRKEAYYGLREAVATLIPGGVVGGDLGSYLESDIDEDGNPWGHLWMQPEPVPLEEEGGVNKEKLGESGALIGGDSRPDWLQEDYLWLRTRSEERREP